MTIKSTGGIFGRNPTFNNVDVEGALTVDGNVYPSAPDILVSGDIGVTVQGYDVDTAKLDVVQTWSASQTFLADAVLRVFGKSDGIGYELVGRPADGYSRFQSYDRSGTVTTGSLSFFEDGSIGINRGNTGSTIENAKFTTAGNLAFVSGQGIDFSATAGTGTSELFDDYEEGVFTPTIAGSTAAGTATYPSQKGSYTKIGNVVQIQIYLSWNTHTGTGNMQIQGLPFNEYAVTDFHASAAIGFFGNIALTAGNFPVAYGSPNTTRINVGQHPTGGGAFSSVPMDAAGEIMVTMVYRAPS